MRKLAKQVVLVAKTNDVPQGVVTGQYPIGLAASPTRTRQFIKEGGPVKYLHPKEGSHMATQGMVFIANAPHPNAAKLFFHWFYGREGQNIYAPKTQVISVRKDVPQDYLPAEQRYVEGRPFMMAALEDQRGKKPQELLKLGKRIFKEGK